MAKGRTALLVVTALLCGGKLAAQSGTFTAGLSAANSFETSAGTLTLTVAPNPPVITSPLTASGQAGQAFSYQITASNAPTIFFAAGLPYGLSLDETTGIISGTPTANVVDTVILEADNAAGVGTSLLTLRLPCLSSP